MIISLANELIEKVHYIENDASFKAFQKYAYCIFHRKHNNKTVPFCLTVYPIESFELYNLL